MPLHDTPWPDGSVCWVDYTADDLTATQSFYAELLGWTFDDGDPQYGGYLTCRLGGRAVAGMMPRTSPEQPTAWTTCFASHDAAATAGRIEAAGGTVVAPPMAVGPLGTMVVALDAQGHLFEVWQADAFIGFEVTEQAGTRVWSELGASDPDAARSFYGGVLGVEHEPVPGASADYTVMRVQPGDQLGGIGRSAPGASDGWVSCFGVRDTDAAVALVERAGGTTTTPPVDSPYGRFAVLQDPWGAAFSVMSVPQG